MSLKHLICFVVILVCKASISYAGIVKGRVTDEKGKALPYASIYIQGTTTGTGTNSDGYYELQLTPGTHKLTCMYVGYKQRLHTLTIQGNETIEYNFSLEEQQLQINEVVVRAGGEDPAYRIIRNAIARRNAHLQQVKSFQTGIYMKGVLRVDIPDRIMGQRITVQDKTDMGLDTAGNGVLYVCEEDADYYASGGKEHTVIHSVRESGNPQGVGFNRMLPVITFYENNVNVLTGDSRGFISPVSDNALSYYKYKLLGSFILDGQKVYKIKLMPKREYESVFAGTIYIADEDWAIQGIDVFLTKKSGLDMLDTVRIEQVHLPMRKDVWVVQQQVFRIKLQIMMIGAGGAFVTVYSRQKVNEPVPDSVFDDKVISVYDKAANKKDTSYWKTRPVPLEKDEIRYYQFSDSLYAVKHTDAYLDSMRRIAQKVSMQSMLTQLRFSSRDGKDVVTANGILGLVNFNTVEGVNIAPSPTWLHRIDTGRYLQVDAAARYGFANRHFNGIGRVSYIYDDNYWKKRTWKISVEGGQYVFQYNPENPVRPFFNTVATLVGGRNPLKLYERKELAVLLGRNYGNGFSWKIKAGWQQRIPLFNTTTYSFRNERKTEFTDNLPDRLKPVTIWEQHDAALLHVGLSYQPGYRYVQYPDYKIGGSRKPVFTLDYDKGIQGLFNSKVDFDRWRAGMRGNVSLQRLGNVSYNVSAGGFLNANYVSVPDLKHLHGNYRLGIATAYLNSFQLIGFYDYSNKEPLYGEAHIEYNMMGLLSNKIPVMKRALWHLVAGSNTFYATQSNYYTEAFIGVANIGWSIFRIGRIDFIQGWSSGGKTSGIRIGLDMPGAINIATPQQREDSEW